MVFLPGEVCFGCVGNIESVGKIVPDGKEGTVLGLCLPVFNKEPIALSENFQKSRTLSRSLFGTWMNGSLLHRII